jgi:hypothetical protein
MSLCASVSLQLIEPILQDLVEIGQAVFYKTIQPFESILSVGDLTLKHHNALILALGFLGTSRLQEGLKAERLAREAEAANRTKAG